MWRHQSRRNAPWLKRSKKVEEIRVVDLDRGVERPKRAILIQRQAQAQNDSKYTSGGFDYCSFAVQQRVLQHNLPEAGIAPLV
jgi:hypothetical protein